MAGGQLFEISGADAEPFLQNLVTNDLKGLATGAVYAALLSPQGKYLADFFLVRHEGRLLLDIAPVVAEATVRKLTMYKLRADVRIAESALGVALLPDRAEGAVADPRHPALGYRIYGGGSGAAADLDALRVAHVIPETGIELVPDDSYILEMGFERLHGVDFRKGCYVGQEVTARMKHKTELRKGLVQVAVAGAAAPGTEIHADGKPVGTLHTRAGDLALAYLRFDRAAGEMRAGEAVVRLSGGGAG